MKKAFAGVLIVAALVGAAQAANFHEPQTAAVELLNITLPTDPPATTAPWRHATPPAADTMPDGLSSWSVSWRNARPHIF